MPKFQTRACKFVKSMVEPLLRDGLQGTIRAELLDGSLDITVPITGRDHRRLESSHWALNALLRTFAQAVATDLPEGVPSDAIAILLTSPATKSRAKIQATEPQQLLNLPPEVLQMPLGQLLASVRMPNQAGPNTFRMSVVRSAPETGPEISVYGYLHEGKLIEDMPVIAWCRNRNLLHGHVRSFSPNGELASASIHLTTNKRKDDDIYALTNP